MKFLSAKNLTDKVLGEKHSSEAQADNGMR